MRDGLFNQKEKEEFLNTLASEEVQNVFIHLFEKSKGTEELYQKDLYSFSLLQIEDVMRNVNPATINSATNTKSRIATYITWAIRNGRRVNNINPIQGTTFEWQEQFIDKSVKRHLSDHEIYEIVEGLYNAQDQALIQCLYEGIMGMGLSELLSMRASKIDWENNIVTVKDDRYEEERNVKVSDRCIKFIENAYKQTTYLSENTENEKELIEYQDFIFKNVKWRASKFNKINMSGLARRLAVIKETYDLEEFHSNTISESGRIKMAYDICKTKGKLEKEDFEKIGDRFNLSKMESKGYRYYNTGKMKHYINEKNLKNLYNIDCTIN